MAATREQALRVETSDGCCPVTLHFPAANGRSPGVIVYMDAPRIRPALHAIAARIAAAGYAVALPDLFYRGGPYAPIDPKVVFTDPALRAEHRAQRMAGFTPEGAMADTGALLAAMREVPAVADGPVGVVGYCLGGRLALIAAATFPDDVAVAASFHGGGLANDAPMSPHLLAPRMRATVYVAGAVDDANFPDAMKERLAAALTAAGVGHRVETYPAKHGWVPADTAAHDPVEAEHHWSELIPLLDRCLKG